jgi:hypothetical protein
MEKNGRSEEYRFDAFYSNDDDDNGNGNFSCYFLVSIGV